MPEGNGVLNITDESFDKVIATGTTLVDFWAPWCLPCRIQGPILSAVSRKLGDRVKVCKLNVDDNQETAFKYQIASIPTLIVFKDGRVNKTFIGVQDEKSLMEAVK